MFQISWVFEFTAIFSWFLFERQLSLPGVTLDSTRGLLACQPGTELIQAVPNVTHFKE